jgi:hypothetical protein
MIAFNISLVRQIGLWNWKMVGHCIAVSTRALGMETVTSNEKIAIVFANYMQVPTRTCGTVFHELAAEDRFPLFFVRKPSHAAPSSLVPLSEALDRFAPYAGLYRFLID